MATEQSERERLITTTANRLRMIQLDLADESQESRQEYMTDEVERAASSLPVAERKPFLDELISRFPSWDAKVEIAIDEGATLRSDADEREMRDASFLVSRLIEVGDSLSDGERQVLRDRLVSAGLFDTGARVSWRNESADALRTALELPENEHIDATRVVEAFEMLATFASGLDRLAWKTWQEVAPKSRVRGSGKLQQNMGRFAIGDEQVVRGNISTDLERLRQLVAALVLAIRRASGDFGQQYVSTFAIPAIERLVDVEGKRGLFTDSKEARCWKKYCELAGDLSQRTIERDIMNAVAEYASRMMDGTGS